jgi:hypothetical protein
MDMKKSKLHSRFKNFLSSKDSTHYRGSTRQRWRYIIFVLFVLLCLTFVLNSFLYKHLNDVRQVEKSELQNMPNSNYNEFFKSVDRSILSITKQLSLHEINKYVQYHNDQIELFLEKMQMEKETLDNEVVDQVDDETNHQVNYEYSGTKTDATVKPPKGDNIPIDFVDRNLIIKYLKIERYFLTRKSKSLNSVKNLLVENRLNMR